LSRFFYLSVLQFNSNLHQTLTEVGTGPDLPVPSFGESESTFYQRYRQSSKIAVVMNVGFHQCSAIPWKWCEIRC